MQAPPVQRGNSGNGGLNGNRPADRPAATPNAASKGNKPQNKVADDLHLNPKLEERVKGMLPANTSLDDASAGFKNRGQFIAALQASKNLDIPFSQLKARMTGNDPSSLGESIGSLRPELGKAKANDEAKRAEKAADDLEKAAKQS